MSGSLFVVCGLIVFAAAVYYHIRSWRSGSIVTFHSLYWTALFLFIFVTPLLYPRQHEFTADVGFILILACGIAGSFVASSLFSLRNAGGQNSRAGVRLNPVWVNAGMFSYAAFLAYRLISFIIASGGLTAALARSSKDEHLGSGYLVGTPLLELAMILPHFLFLIGVARLWMRGGRFRALVLYALAPVTLIFTAPTRFGFIMYVAAFLIFAATHAYTNRNAGDAHSSRSARSVGLRKSVIAGLLVAVLTVGYMYVGELVRSGAIIARVDGGSLWDADFAPYTVTNSLRYAEFIDELHGAHEDGVVPFEYGEGWFYYGVISLVPRAFWPSKPVTALGPRMTELLHGDLGEGQAVYVYTILGEGFVQFGFAGVFVAPILFFCIILATVRLLSHIENAHLAVLYVLFRSVTQLRSELPIPKFLVEISLLLFVFYALRLSSPGGQRGRDASDNILPDWGRVDN